jgi:hypothetical protein
MSILDALTITHFKKIYYKDFQFSSLKEWNEVTNYLIDNEVLYFSGISYYVYKATLDNTNKQPDINTLDWEKQSQNINSLVFDKDIEEYFDYCKTQLSSVLTSDELIKKAFFLLIAHKLQSNIVMYGDKTNSNQISSRSLGGGSVSYNVNQNFLSLSLNDLSTTRYGKEYISLCTRHNTRLFSVSSGGED